MRSCKGGWHGTAGWSRFRGFPETAAGLRADDGPNSLPDAGSPVAAPDLRLEELRHVSEISGAEGLPGVLAGKAGRPAAFGDGCAFQADQARRAARRGWRIPAALTRARIS